VCVCVVEVDKSWGDVIGWCYLFGVSIVKGFQCFLERGLDRSV